MPIGSPFSSPLGFQLTENNTGWLEVYLKTADKPLRSPFSSPMGLQLTLYGWQVTFKLPLLGQLGLPGNRHRKAKFLNYILTADKPLRSPFSSPLGLQLTFSLLTCHLDRLSAHLLFAANFVSADKPVGLPFSSPLGWQLTFSLLTCHLDHLSAHLLFAANFVSAD